MDHPGGVEVDLHGPFETTRIATGTHLGLGVVIEIFDALRRDFGCISSAQLSPLHQFTFNAHLRIGGA